MVCGGCRFCFSDDLGFLLYADLGFFFGDSCCAFCADLGFCSLVLLPWLVVLPGALLDVSLGHQNLCLLEAGLVLQVEGLAVGATLLARLAVGATLLARLAVALQLEVRQAIHPKQNRWHRIAHHFVVASWLAELQGGFSPHALPVEDS